MRVAGETTAFVREAGEVEHPARALEVDLSRVRERQGERDGCRRMDDPVYVAGDLLASGRGQTEVARG